MIHGTVFDKTYLMRIEETKVTRSLLVSKDFFASQRSALPLSLSLSILQESCKNSDESPDLCQMMDKDRKN